MNTYHNKKGFTIVELVIVIAVIAILAAVLIPTFAGLVEAANTSADIQLVRQINTMLAAEQPNSTAELIQALEDNGFALENLSPTVKGRAFYWVPGENMMAYCDVEEDHKVLYPEDTKLAWSDLWVSLPLAGTVSVAKVQSGVTTMLSATADNTESSRVSVSVPAGATGAKQLQLEVTDETPGGVNLLRSKNGKSYVAGNYVFDISLTDENKTPVVATGESFTVNIELPGGLDASTMKVYHQDDLMDSVAWNYDSASGNLAITTNSFSPYRVTWNSDIVKLEASDSKPESLQLTSDTTPVSYAVKFDIPKSGTADGKFIEWVFVADRPTAYATYTNITDYVGAYISLGHSGTELLSEFEITATWFGNWKYDYARGTVDEWRVMLSEEDITDWYLRVEDEAGIVPGTLELRLYDSADTTEYIVLDSLRLEP